MKLETLFYTHLADLRSIAPDIEDIFICPICMEEFVFEDISKEKLSKGDVWPKYIREKSASKLPAQQIILLCKNCNSKAGSRGDKQMQLREKIKDGKKVGKIHGERYVQIIRNPDEPSIDLRATITLQDLKDKKKAQITFNIDKKTSRWARNNPQEQDRFESIISQGESVNVIVHPHSHLNAELPTVGWITSAYLYAFYTFGYRYIFDDNLDPVRAYIHNSFDKNMEEPLQIPETDIMSLKETKEYFYEHPEINLVFPLANSPIYLQIGFLDYHIRLPFQAVPHVLQALVSNIPDLDRLLENTGENDYLCYPIGCNKSGGLECLWDYVLGKPPPYDRSIKKA